MHDLGHVLLWGRVARMAHLMDQQAARGQVLLLWRRPVGPRIHHYLGSVEVAVGGGASEVLILKPERKATAEELSAFVKERLASFKVPKYYAFVGELPRNYVGKVLKTDLRKQFGEPKSGE